MVKDVSLVGETRSEARALSAVRLPSGRERWLLDADPRAAARAHRFVRGRVCQRAGGFVLDVDLSPGGRCNFACQYCGTRQAQVRCAPAANTRVIIRELCCWLTWTSRNQLSELAEYRRLPADLRTLKRVLLSGTGEPTLCPNFGDVVELLSHLRAQTHLPMFRLALVTNGSRLHLDNVRHGLEHLTSPDEVWVKLDVGTEDQFRRLQQPDVAFSQLLANILWVGRRRPIVIQTLFPMVDRREPAAEEVAQYAVTLRALIDQGTQVDRVQVYSAQPRNPDDLYRHLPLRSLSVLAQQIHERCGVPVEVF